MPASACAMARMWSGVVPQQPPAMLMMLACCPLLPHSTISSASACGVSS